MTNRVAIFGLLVSENIISQPAVLLETSRVTFIPLATKVDEGGEAICMATSPPYIVTRTRYVIFTSPSFGTGTSKRRVWASGFSYVWEADSTSQSPGTGSFTRTVTSSGL